MDAFLGILGTTALLLDGKLSDKWGKPRERAVLATLAVHANRVVPFSRLIEWAWPADKPLPQNPAETFHLYAGRIRRALRRLPTPADVLPGQGGYRLEMDRSLIDFYRFRELLTRAGNHLAEQEPDEAISVVEDALSLFRGTPVADLSTPRAEAWRGGVIQNQLLAANTMLLEQLLVARRFDEAIARLDDLHADYPNDVTLAELRLSALFGARRGTHATAFYFATRTRLVKNGEEQAAEHLRQHQDALWAAHTTTHHPTPTRPPQLLPPAHRGFVGRGELLDALDAAVPADTPTGVVIVDGAGGVGKTALVLHWAHQRQHLFPDGNLFVNLHGYAHRAMTEHAVVVDHFLGALGHSPSPVQPPSAREQLLSSLLADRKTLVVLDNARDSDHVRGLLPLLTNCLVIITSRQLLVSLRTETGARQITVPPMTPAESADLLTAQLGPLGERQRTELVALCGGLPLLLTVLAGNLANKSATAIERYATVLDRRQLVVGIADHGDGPTSGADCFEPSYQALTPAERRLFRLLAQHPGPEFGLDAACACAGQPVADTRRGIGRLVGLHLVEEADSAVNRFRFHDVLAEYARYCRDRDESPEERAAATHRVLDYYVGSATQACQALQRSYNPPPGSAPPTVPVPTFATSEDAVAWFAGERANLISALTYAGEHDHHEHAWRLADPVAAFLDRAGANLECRDVRMIGARAAHAMGNVDGESSLLNGLGMVHMRLGDHQEAHRCLTEAHRLAVEDKQPRGQAVSLHLLGCVALRRGNPAEALDLFHRGMAIDHRSGNQEGLCWAHARIGQALHVADQHSQAVPHLHEAVRIAHEIGETSAESMSLRELGAIHHELGDLASATTYCQQALAIAQSVPDLPAIAETCTVLCEINTVLHRTLAAIGFGRRAVEVCERTRDLAQHARALEVLGAAQHACGDLVDAVVAWQQAAELYEHTGNAANAGRLRAKIGAVPVFYQEIVPIARRAEEAEAPRVWLAEDQSTRPITGDGR